MRRAFSCAALVGAAALAACSEGLLRPPAPAGPATVALAASLLGGSPDAYQKVNQLSVRFMAGDEQRLAEVVPFDPGAPQTVIELEVPLNDVTESFQIQLDLLSAGQALFHGSGTAQVSAGGTNQVPIQIVPVVSGVTCAGTPFQIAVYQAARRITAAALFASGDTVPDIAISWSSSNASIVTVNQAGDLTGLQDGSATVTCSAQGFSSTRQVEVSAVVASIHVLPALDTVAVGTSATFTATLLDSLGHVITAPRDVAWSSSNAGVATVNASGVATGVTVGNTIIRATSGDATGTAGLLVLFPPPVVASTAATGVSARAATLNGSVNPQGFIAEAWFEWGTSPTLAGAASTSPQQLPASSTPQGFSQPLSGLLSNQTYYFRAVANGMGGLARGSILGFTTHAPPTVRTIGGTPMPTGATLQGGVNPEGLATQAWFEWGTDPTLQNRQQTTPQQFAAGNRAELPMGASLTNLVPGVTYYFRAAASNSVGTSYGQIMTVRANSLPTANTQPATLNGLIATLAGIVNPGGLSTDVWFEWGTSPSLLNHLTPAQNIGSGGTDVPVSADVGNLVEGQTYYFRVAAHNSLGTTWGNIRSFTAPRSPTATTGSPSGIGANSATLQGAANPNGTATNAWFEWGVGPSPNSFNSTPPQSVGAGTAAVAVSQLLMGLSPGTTYTFRLAASNAVGTTRGSPVTFTTVGPPFVSGTGSDWVYVPGGVIPGYWSTTFFGTVTPNGATTTAWFEIAADAAFSQPIGSTSAVSAGAGFSPVNYQRVYNGLPGCGPYYYRAVASNAYGTVRGAARYTYCEGGGLP